VIFSEPADVSVSQHIRLDAHDVRRATSTRRASSPLDHPQKVRATQPPQDHLAPDLATFPAAIKLATRFERVRAAIHVALVGAGLQNVQPKKDAAILF
jgi:hypothetical protein